MAAALNVGDRVQICTREQTDEDIKKGNYYRHFGGLTGTVQKVFNAEEIAVDVELEALSRPTRKRHDEIRQQMKTKWLDGLSEEGRNRLTEREKDFNLRYVVLVAPADLEKIAKLAPKAAASIEAKSEEEAEPKRLSLEEIEAAEAAELEKRMADGAV